MFPVGVEVAVTVAGAFLGFFGNVRLSWRSNSLPSFSLDNLFAVAGKLLCASLMVTP